jgi:Ca2+-binding EF-hand superfamily protein
MKHSSRLLVTAALLLPFAAALAQTPPPAEPADPATAPPSRQAPSQQGGTTFEQLDTDSDGRISRTEAEVNANVKAQFSSYDLNGDGFIERAEVNQANTPKAESPQQ